MLGFVLTFLAATGAWAASISLASAAKNWRGETLAVHYYGAALGAVGGVVGIVIWSVAYRYDGKRAGALGDVR
jgi:hypothetical protein